MNAIVNNDMNEYWNGEGGQTWVRFQERIDASLVPFGEQAMAVTNISAGDSVLDIGCGCGDTSFEIARRVGDSGFVHGIDISKLILEQARVRAQASPQNNISFKEADAQSHPFESMSFDRAFSRFGVMFFTDSVAAFSNIRQAIKPGGRIVFICWQSIKDNQWVNLPLQITGNHIPLPPPATPGDPGPFSFADPYRVKHILTSAGFANISIQRFETKFIVGETANQAVTFLTNIGPAGATLRDSAVDEQARQLVVAELHNALEQHKTKQGILLDAAAWIVTCDR